jgi:hypothetical protein
VVKPYIEGRLSLQEVANILGCDRSDAAAFLEEVGYCRSLETIEIPDAERVTMLARVRAEREKRAGQPQPERSRVVRDVIASQRIEGVEARPWIRPT